VTGRKATYSVELMRAHVDPFELRISEAWVSDAGMRGAFEDVWWDLRWTPSERCYEPVHPTLQKLRIASTALVLPDADVSVEGSIGFGGQRIELDGAKGAQAHLWGSRHASSWAWAHCNDLSTISGEPVDDAFVDGVSALVSRLGREVGPSTPVVARIDGKDFVSTSPLRIVSNLSTFALTGWRFEAISRGRNSPGSPTTIPTGRPPTATTRKPRRSGCTSTSARAKSGDGRTCRRWCRLGGPTSSTGSGPRSTASSF
jgi:hypothetical protein